jgi:hypothetical protein
MGKQYNYNVRTNGVFLPTLEMGASCTCKMQVQCKFRQFRGVLRKSPAPTHDASARGGA